MLRETSKAWSDLKQARIKDIILRTILDQMILGQTQKSTATGQALREQETARDGELVLLRLGPAVGVLEKAWKGGLLERLLEVFIPWLVGRPYS